MPLLLPVNLVFHQMALIFKMALAPTTSTRGVGFVRKTTAPHYVLDELMAAPLKSARAKFTPPIITESAVNGSLFQSQLSQLKISLQFTMLIDFLVDTLLLNAHK